MEVLGMEQQIPKDKKAIAGQRKARWSKYGILPGVRLLRIAASSRSSTTSLLQGEKVIELLKRIADKDETALSEVQTMLPAAAEEADADQLRQQQKTLNQVQRLQTKLGKKEASIQTKEQQMQKFMQDIKQHVEAERSRHKKEVEQINQEITEIKSLLQLLKSGKAVSEAPEEEMEDLFNYDDEEKSRLKEQLAQSTKEQAEMRQQVAYMQMQMEAFMHDYKQLIGKEGQPTEGLVGLPPTTPQEPIKTPMTVLSDEEKNNYAKDPKAPFGLRTQSRAARENASPYGREKAQCSDYRTKFYANKLVLAEHRLAVLRATALWQWRLLDHYDPEGRKTMDAW